MQRRVPCHTYTPCYPLNKHDLSLLKTDRLEQWGTRTGRDRSERKKGETDDEIDALIPSCETNGSPDISYRHSDRCALLILISILWDRAPTIRYRRTDGRDIFLPPFSLLFFPRTNSYHGIDFVPATTRALCLLLFGSFIRWEDQSPPPSSLHIDITTVTTTIITITTIFGWWKGTICCDGVLEKIRTKEDTGRAGKKT